MSRLVHAHAGRTEHPGDATYRVRYACGAAVLVDEHENGWRAITRSSLELSRVTCEACRHAVQQREAG